VCGSELRGIASIPQIKKLNALYDSAAVNIKAGDNSFSQHF
jgi:hypothetical protein